MDRAPEQRIDFDTWMENYTVVEAVVSLIYVSVFRCFLAHIEPFQGRKVMQTIQHVEAWLSDEPFQNLFKCSVIKYHYVTQTI